MQCVIVEANMYFRYWQNTKRARHCCIILSIRFSFINCIRAASSREVVGEVVDSLV